MCGIAGFYGFGNNEILSLMTSALAPRGPDEIGYYCDNKKKVFFGHRRLSIIDLNDGKQPMANNDKSIYVIFNGEIYNHNQIRVELENKGYKFKTSHSDTEVLIHGYEEWGEGLVLRLNGMFAFAIYIPNKNTIFLARDRFGEKPLYYYHDKNSFIFSSDLNSIKLHPSTPNTINNTSLQKYLGYGFLPAPLTLYNKIFKLPAGSTISYDLGNPIIKVKKYWDFKIEPDENYINKPISDVSDELQNLLSVATKDRMESDVPLGFFLSGGLDSSLIVALANKHKYNKAIKTFSVGFDDSSFDESKFAKSVASFLNTDHYSEQFTEKSLLELINKILPEIDDPIADPSLLPTFLISQSAKKHVNVVLTGDGADELFGGYAPLKAIKVSSIYSKIIPPAVHKLIVNVTNLMPVSHNYMSLDFKIKRALLGLSYKENLWNPVWMSHLSKDQIEEILMKPVELENIYSEAIDLWDRDNNKNEIDKTLEFYTKLYLTDNILVKVDRASMMNSLECRAPFLDNNVVDFARKLPNKFKLYKNHTKYILKKSAENLIPLKNIYRKKQGFGVPIGKWFKDNAINFNKIKSDKVQNKSSVLVSKAMIDKSLKNHKSNRCDNRLTLFNILTLQKHKDIYF